VDFDTDGDTRRPLLGSSIEEIRSKPLIDNYDSLDSQSKHLIAEVAKQNGKTLVGDVESVDKVRKMVEYEDMKSHVAQVEYSKRVHTSGDFPDPTSGKITNVPDFSTPLSLMRNTKFSQSKFARSLATITASKGVSRFAKGTGKVLNPVGKFLMVKNIIKGIQSGDTTSLAITGVKLGFDFVVDRVVSHGTKVFKLTGTLKLTYL